MKASSFLTIGAWCLFLSLTQGMQMSGRTGHGFVGHGISMYKPWCAFACKDSISAPLNCTMEDMMHDEGGMSMKLKKRHGSDHEGPDLPSGDGWMVMKGTPSCMAHNDHYLQTLAHCVHMRCHDVPLHEIEKFWADDALGHAVNQPVPKMSFSQAVASMSHEGIRELNNSVLLDYVGIVTDESWLPAYNADSNFETTETTHARFGIIILASCAVLPIALSLLRFLPWPAALTSRLHAYLIDPPLFGAHHSAPILLGLGIMPTRGQALFIAYIWIINIVLSAAGYHIIWPHSWYASKRLELMTYVSNRVGVLSFANLPLAILFSGRNNFLLWVTNWSHSTFLLIHRWIAFICMLQAVLHSILYLHLYLQPGRDHAEESRLPYWIWGIIATLALAIMIPASVPPVRHRMYEAFLASHVVLAILALIGCFLHIYYRFGLQWGYDTWIYIAVGVWLFDRLMRVARTLRNGNKKAIVTAVDDEYVRVDVPGLMATGHVYMHFPGVSLWKFWENHPFSVAGVMLESGVVKDAMAEQRAFHDPEEKKHNVSETVHGGSSGGSSHSVPARRGSAKGAQVLGTTFFIRKNKGLTSLLARKPAHAKGITVHVESSYGPGATILQDDAIVSTPQFPNILCIAGGVGITAILPILDRASNGLGHDSGRVKLYWGVRTTPLVHAVEGMLHVGTLGDDLLDSGSQLDRRWGTVPVRLAVGERFDLRAVLEEELAGKTSKGGTTVVVCGPAGMADEVRCLVSGLGRHGAVVRLVVESFSW